MIEEHKVMDTAKDNVVIRSWEEVQDTMRHKVVTTDQLEMLEEG